MMNGNEPMDQERKVEFRIKEAEEILDCIWSRWIANLGISRQKPIMNRIFETFPELKEKWGFMLDLGYFHAMDRTTLSGRDSGMRGDLGDSEGGTGNQTTGLSGYRESHC